MAIAHVALLDEEVGIAHGTGGIFEQELLLLGRHQAEKVTGLAVIIVVVLTLVVVVHRATYLQGWFFHLGTVLPLTEAVRLVADGASVVAVHPHGSVAMIGMERTARTVHGNLLQVDTEPITLGIAIGEETALQHLVGRETDAIDGVDGIESRLLHLCKIVFGIAVQLQDAYIVQGEVSMRPHLRQVKGIDAVMVGLLLGHQLHLEKPTGIIATLDALVEVALVRLTVFSNDGLSLLIGQALNALQGAQVELHPGAYIVAIDKTVGMASESVHVAVRTGNAARTHGDGHLMQRFGQGGPEIPVVGRTAHVGTRVALDGMVQVGKLQWVAQEEDGRIVAHQVPIARLGIELHGKATDIALGIGRSALASYGRKAHEALRLLAHFAEDGGTGIARDVMRHRKGAVCSRTLGVHTPFGNHLAVEVCQFFQEPRILQGDRPTRAHCLDVLIVCHGTSVGCGQSFLFHKHILKVGSIDRGTTKREGILFQGLLRFL